MFMRQVDCLCQFLCEILRPQHVSSSCSLCLLRFIAIFLVCGDKFVLFGLDKRELIMIFFEDPPIFFSRLLKLRLIGLKFLRLLLVELGEETGEAEEFRYLVRSVDISGMCL